MRTAQHSSPLASHCPMWALLLIAIWLGAGCAEHAEFAIPTGDRAVFEMQVLPVLIRDCAFHACHGSFERFFQVFGPGHGRLAPETRSLDPITPAEIEHSFARALSMLDAEDLEHSLLLRKPLAVAASGAGHEGTDALGRDVYQTTADPSYQLLRKWVIATARSQ